jgi:hypothetical protein
MSLIGSPAIYYEGVNAYSYCLPLPQKGLGRRLPDGAVMAEEDTARSKVDKP